MKRLSNQQLIMKSKVYFYVILFYLFISCTENNQYNTTYLVKKTENMRIFTPEQNVDADAYKFDYRIYYDAFVSKNDLDLIYAWVSPNVNITFQPFDRVVDTETPVTLEFYIDSPEPYRRKWYQCSDLAGSNPKLVHEETGDGFTISYNDYLPGTYYFFARAYADALHYVQSDVATISV